MTANAVGNVLGILRLLRSGNYGNPIFNHVSDWCGGPIDPIKVAKVCGYVLENAFAAETQIQLSQLSDEAKAGLLQTVDSLKQAFLFNQMNNSLQHYFPALDASISSFAILVSASGLSEGLANAAEIDELVTDIEVAYANLDQMDLHPLVRETAKRHIAVLVTLLKNAQSLGVDAAMAAYFELMIHLKRAEQAKPTNEKATDSAFWNTLKEWGSRLTTISDITDKGGSLLAHADKVVPLLQNFIA